MSLQLSTLGLGLPVSIHNKKTISHFSRYTRLSLQLTRQELKQAVTKCSKTLSVEENVSVDSGSKEDDLRTKFVEVYSVLKYEMLNDPDFEWTHDSRQWVHQMLDYNVPTGKAARGFSVVNSYKLLKEGKELSEDEVSDASIVGWCVEWLEGTSLILDDFTDGSHTRRDQPCWFRVPKVGKIAINDAVLLMAHVPRILKKHFREKPYYVDLLDLFNEVVFLATSGQMLDLITPVGERDLSNYTLHKWVESSPVFDAYINAIVILHMYKTGYFTFYLPVACALLLAGENLEKHVNIKDVLLEMGIYFQIMNDYLDCFGNPEKTCKIGTDIEDFKCSWLIVKALEICNQEQKKILHEHYGKANPSDVAKVKGVYNDINLQGVFAVYVNESYEKLKNCVEAHPNRALDGIWEILASYRQLLKKLDL